MFDLVSRALRSLPGGSTVDVAVRRITGAAGTVLELPRHLAQGMQALPRIAAALERTAGLEESVRELGRVHNSLVRLEQLGTFIAEELPEYQHQVDGLREQLDTLANRLGELSRAMLNLTLTPRELNRVLHEITGTIGPLEGVARRLENVSGTKPGPRAAEPAADAPATKKRAAGQ